MVISYLLSIYSFRGESCTHSDELITKLHTSELRSVTTDLLATWTVTHDSNLWLQPSFLPWYQLEWTAVLRLVLMHKYNTKSTEIVCFKLKGHWRRLILIWGIHYFKNWRFKVSWKWSVYSSSHQHVLIFTRVNKTNKTWHYFINCTIKNSELKERENCLHPTNTF